jgi:5-formyltetrahydrofolate cyclo-ligase
MNKQQLRKVYKQMRLDIDPKDKLTFDDMMLLQLQQFNFNSIKTLLTYWPMASVNEPNTHLFSSYLRHIIPNLRIAYPVANFETNTFNAIEINEDTVYTTNQYLITQPTKGNLIYPKEIDLIFVPMFTCDSEGFRVGFGKGFYDKFIANCSDSVVLIGFNYFNPVVKIDDINHLDFPLSYCITPNEVYEF